MGNNIYVLFETGRACAPKRRFNVPQRVTIGKLLPGADDSLMQPNEKFLELFPKRCLEQVEPAPGKHPMHLVFSGNPQEKTTAAAVVFVKAKPVGYCLKFQGR